MILAQHISVLSNETLRGFLLVKPYLSPAFNVAVMWHLSKKLRAGTGSPGLGEQRAARWGHWQGWFWANQVLGNEIWMSRRFNFPKWQVLFVLNHE